MPREILCVLVRYPNGEAVFEPWPDVRRNLPLGAWIDWTQPELALEEPHPVVSYLEVGPYIDNPFTGKPCKPLRRISR